MLRWGGVARLSLVHLSHSSDAQAVRMRFGQECKCLAALNKLLP